MRREKRTGRTLPLLLALVLTLTLAAPAIVHATGDVAATSEVSSSSETAAVEETAAPPAEETPAEDTVEETPAAEEPAAAEEPSAPAAEEPVYFEDKEPVYDFVEISNEEFDRIVSEQSGTEAEEISDDDPLARTTREATGAQVVRVPATVEDFRFWTVAKRPAIALAELSFREAADDTSRAVGSIAKDGVLYVLETRQDGWIYAESGAVRGFVRADQLKTGEEAEEVFRALLEKAEEDHPDVDGEELYLWIDAPAAEELVPHLENGALTYLRATVHRAVADKIYALAKADNTFIYEEKKESSRRIGRLDEKALCYVLDGVTRTVEVEAGSRGKRWIEEHCNELLEKLMLRSSGGDAEKIAKKVEKLQRERDAAREKIYRIESCDEWLYVESDDVRGFVKSAALTVDDALQESMREANEEEYKKAVTLTLYKNNAALYHTLTSIKSGVPGGKVKESIVDYAAQFIGNPYVWGGTDPVRGADCSGFVQTIYRQFGYALPRLAQQQAMVGTMVDLEDAEPGDLIFYQNGKGEIYHVVIYAGNGETVEAANESDGIVRGTVAGDACWAVRVIEDDLVSQIPETYEGYPVGTNNCYTVTHNYGTRKWAYPCRRILHAWQEAGSVYTDNVATIDGHYLIACTPLFGTVGDMIVWHFDDGSTLSTIMADTKSSSDPNYTPWGHIAGDVINVVEFETNRLIHPGTADCIPQIGWKRVTGWTNLGRVL